MGSNASTYSPEEIDAIAEWLLEDSSATEIANRLSKRRRQAVSRNAIIGIVHRNKRLAAIGLNGGGGRPAKGAVIHPAPSAPRVPKPKQNLRAGNIRGKKEGRAFDPVFVPVQPKPADDGISPYVYDGCARHVALIALLHRECRWPVNDPSPGEQHFFCGAATGIDSVYCQHHARRAVARAA